MIELTYPGCITYINKLMHHRPKRTHKTDVVYYHGPPGKGKTLNIARVLRTISKLYPAVSYYSKLGGLSRWFDGYDNEQIVWIDDPVAMNGKGVDEEQIQRLKNIMSEDNVMVEIKGGAMIFDSSIIIISANLSPADLARSCGSDNELAIYRRFTDTYGEAFIDTRATASSKLTEHLTSCIAHNILNTYNIHIDVKHVIQNLPPIKIRNYSAVTAFAQCNASKYFD